jgi:Flp pilus assembly protein TadB
MSERDSTVKTGPTHIVSSNSGREQVERTADRIRDELLLTLGELERRRERVMDMHYQVSQHQTLLIGLGVAAVTVVGVGVGIGVWRARHRQELLAKKRRLALQRAWQNPDRLATRAPQAPLSVELGRKLVIIFGSALATAVARNAVQGLVPQRRTVPAK